MEPRADLDDIFSALREINGRLSRIETRLASLIDEEDYIMATLQDLQDQVAADTTVDAGFVKIITALQANQNDPAKLDALLTSMKANSASISAALATGTAAPPPAGTPVPPVVNPAPV